MAGEALGEREHSLTRRRRTRYTHSLPFLGHFILLSLFVAAPCNADVLNFSGRTPLPSCAHDCTPLYAAQFSCRSVSDEAGCFCKQDGIKGSQGICDSVCTGTLDRSAIEKFLGSLCGNISKGTKTSDESIALASPSPSSTSSSSSKPEMETNKALDFWKKNWKWFLIGLLGVAVPLTIWALIVPVRRHYKRKRRNTTAIVWSNVGNEDFYTRVPQRGRKNNNGTPVNRAHNTSRGSSTMTMLGVSSMIRSSSGGSASDNEATKSFLTSSEYDSGNSACGAGPAMEDSRAPFRHTVDGYGANGYQRVSPGHSQDLLSVAPEADRSNRYTHPQHSPVPPRQLFSATSGPPVQQQQQQATPKRASQPAKLRKDPPASHRVSQNPAAAPTGRRRSEGQQGHRGPPKPIRMGHHLAEMQLQQQQKQYQQQQQQYQQAQPATFYQQHQHQHQPQPQHTYDSGVRASTTFPLSSRWEQEHHGNHSQHIEQRMPMMHPTASQHEGEDYVDPSQIGRAA